MRGRTRISLLLCGIALALGGCGGSEDDGTIPDQEASDLLALLDTLQADVEQGQCDQVPSTAAEIVSRINDLPADVDPDVKTELAKAATNLNQLAAEPGQCTETGATGGAGVETSTTSTTDSLPTTTEEETTTDEETTTTTTTTTDEQTTPPDETGGGDEDGGGGQDLTPPAGNQDGGGSTGGGGIAPPTGGGDGAK